MDQDNRWRLNVKNLVDHVLEGRDAAKLALFGSTPPPVDSVWNNFSEVLDIVSPSKQCNMSKKEKDLMYFCVPKN